jgi:hypothetical protein
MDISIFSGAETLIRSAKTGMKKKGFWLSRKTMSRLALSTDQKQAGKEKTENQQCLQLN